MTDMDIKLDNANMIKAKLMTAHPECNWHVVWDFQHEQFAIVDLNKYPNTTDLQAAGMQIPTSINFS